jgi:hypothetical protein
VGRRHHGWVDPPQCRRERGQISDSQTLRSTVETSVLEWELDEKRRDLSGTISPGRQPVPTSRVNGESTVGTSPSTTVNATLYELYAKTDLGSIDYGANAFDRDLTWFMIQPLYKITRDIHAVARYSEIGTYDDEEGYHFDGEFLAGGNAAYGYDAKRLSRFSLGINWRINPRTRIKLEVGRDRYYVIDASPFDPAGDNRSHAALEVAVSF